MIELMRESHNETWAKLRKELGDIGGIPRVEWSNRLTKTAGLAFCLEGFVRLSAPIYRKYPLGFVCEILPHELAHIAAWRAFGDRWHGKGWKHSMRVIGLEPHVYWCPDRLSNYGKTI